MDKLLKYARLVFEFKYLDKGKDFGCIINTSRKGVTRCICTPGIAINYILKVLQNCFIEFEGTGELVWNSVCHRYVAQCKNLEETSWYSNFCNEVCIYIHELCEERQKLPFIEQEDAIFSYFRNWGRDKMRENYRLVNGSYRIEKALALLHDKYDNSKNYVYFFSYIAYEYRISWKLTEYLDRLFRLYFFIFPEECMERIKKHSRDMTDRNFFDYNEKVLEEYRDMVSKVEESTENTSTKALSSFIGIDVERMLEFYAKSPNYGDVKDLREVIRQMVNNAKGQKDSVTTVLEDYCFFYRNGNF